ncbi:MAG: hypothetical protein K1X72_27965 [Pyrinomonadaceae bacterium]|nr:hypothetical protein [Pyrinomonadaceae bacterium]
MPKFIDHVVGFGGKIEQVFKETRDPIGFEKQNGRPYQSKIVEDKTNTNEIAKYNADEVIGFENKSVFRKANFEKGSQVCLFAETAWAFNCTCIGISQNVGVLDDYFAIDIAPDDAYCIPMPEIPPTPINGGGGGCPSYFSQQIEGQGDSNDKEHSTGSHNLSGATKTLCFTNTACQSFCEVDKYGEPVATDTGQLEGFLGNLWIHKGDTNTLKGENSGTKGQNISCSGAYGVAFSSCFINCNVTPTFITPAVEAQVTGGNLWNRTINKTITCQ